MQALALRALAVKSPIKATLPCWRLPERVALISTHTRPTASYNISRLVQESQEVPSDSESAMDAHKKADAEAGAKTFHSDRDDMADSFGDTYSTRSSDEGFGQRYTEHIKCGPALSEGAEATIKRDVDPHVEVRREYNESQGSDLQ